MVAPDPLVDLSSSPSSSVGNLSDWLCKGKQYKDVPSYVSDELLRLLQLSEDDSALLPSKKSPISTLLAASFPRSLTFDLIKPNTCFSDSESNTPLKFLLENVVPSHEFINKLRDVVGQAMLDGRKSIIYWPRKDEAIKLPFNAITFWLSLHSAISARLLWNHGLNWVQKQRLSVDQVSRIDSIIKKVPWSGTIVSLGNHLEVNDLPLFLSREMLTDSHVDAMLCRLEARIQESHPTKDAVIIARTEFTQHLTHIPSHPYPNTSMPKDLTNKATLLKDPNAQMPKTIWSVGYSHPLHFGAYSMSHSAEGFKVQWGDSIKRPQPAKMVQGIKKWISHHFPHSCVSFANDLECSIQNDAYSCSIIGINTLKYHLFGDPLWNENEREAFRVSEFLDIIEYHNKHMASTGNIFHTKSAPIPLMLASKAVSLSSKAAGANISLPLVSRENVIVEKSPESKTDLNNNSESHQNTKVTPESLVSYISDNIEREFKSQPVASSPAQVICSGQPALTRKRAYRHSSSDSNDSSNLSSDSLHSRPHTKKKRTNNEGRSMNSKTKQNNSVLDGSFEWHPIRLAALKAKLTELSEPFEIDEKTPTNARLIKHIRCTKWIKMSVPYDISRFKEHLKTCKARLKAKKSLPAAANTHTLDRLFGNQKDNSMSTIEPKPSAKSAIQASKSLPTLWPCPGITKNDDRRVEQYLLRSQAESAGGTSERIIAQDEFGKPYLQLTKAEKRAVTLLQVQSHRWKLDHVHNRVFAIGKNKCLEKVQSRNGGDHSSVKPCTSCKALLSMQGFLTAIAKPIPENKNGIYVPHRNRNAAISEMFTRNHGLAELFLDESNENILLRFVRKYSEGKFEGNDVFLDMIKVMVSRTERKDTSRGTQNMYYPPAFDDWCHELLCIRPEAYRSFQLAFGGRSERSFRQIRSSKPSFSQGVNEQTIQRATQYLKDYGYPTGGPLATGVDDTKLLASYRPYYDGTLKKWFMVGGAGQPMLVNDINLLQDQINDARGQEASKLRLWTLSIPLPAVPPLILAASPISSKNSAHELAKMEEDILRQLVHSEHNLNIISLGSDGTSVEREARRELVRSKFARPLVYSIPDPEPGQGAILVEVIMIEGRTMVFIQDTKHLRKTSRNNLFTGAKALVLGRYLICYEQVWKIAHMPDSPIFIRDVKKLDRQDDRAAARLFAAQTLEFIVEHNDNVGLAAYLFVFGELVDATQNRHISHLDRVKMVLRAKFFKRMWKSFLKTAGYTTIRHFISHEADDIMDIVINGYLGLLYIHRDILESRFPLLPWMHGTETNEHVFGFLRAMIPDFTFLDVLRLIPKLGVRLMAACKRKTSSHDFRKNASGYSHTYADANDANLHFLSLFPNDTEIASMANDAYEEALSIWEVLGYDPSSEVSHPSPPEPISITEDPEISDEEGDTAEEVSDRQNLQNALNAATSLQASGIPSAQVDNTLDECGYAAASLNIADLQYIEKLPDSDPGALEEIRIALANVLTAISAQGPGPAAAVAGLILSVRGTEKEDEDLTMEVELKPDNASSLSDLKIDSQDLSSLIALRYLHQSHESAESVRIRRRTTETNENTDPIPTNSRTKPPSERQLLAKKIYEIIRLDAEQGSSTGLNRKTRHITEASNASGASETGNTANAKVVARSEANRIIKARRDHFSKIALGAELATAKIDLISKLTVGSYGIVVAENELVIGKGMQLLHELLTLYERGGGKTAKHALVTEGETTSIGLVSYMPMQIWHYHRQRWFKALFGSTGKLNLPRYSHLPANSFLYLIPKNSILVQEGGAFLQLTEKFFTDVWMKLEVQKIRILVTVRQLSAMRKRKDAVDVDIDNDNGDDSSVKVD